MYIKVVQMDGAVNFIIGHHIQIDWTGLFDWRQNPKNKMSSSQQYFFLSTGRPVNFFNKYSKKLLI